MVNADSVIQFIEKGGSITTDELRHYIHEMELNARTSGAEGCRRFIIESIKRGRIKKQRRLEQEFGQIILDTNEYLYKLRRLRNGQELDGDPEEQGDSSDKRFMGKEKIKI